MEASPLLEITVALLVVLLAAAAFIVFRRRADREAAQAAASDRESGAANSPGSGTGAAFVPRYSPRAAAVDVSEVVSQLRAPLQRALPEDIRLGVETAGSLPNVRADRGQVELMVAHLVALASDGIPGGGTVTIRTRAASTAVEGDDAGRDDEGVAIEVEAGGAIDPPLLPPLFEPLSAGGGSNGGLRLELATVQALAYHHHGTLRVDTGPAGGTRVAIILPPMGEPRPDLGAFAARGRESVLVVEDEAMVRKIVRRTLEPAGYVILEAPDPLIALDTLESGETVVDLLLSDIVMQHMPGTELARRVRERWPLVRVLYMSGYGHDPAVAEEVAHDGADLVPKPFTPAELLAAVRGALDSLPGPHVVEGER